MSSRQKWSQHDEKIKSKSLWGAACVKLPVRGTIEMEPNKSRQGSWQAITSSTVGCSAWHSLQKRKLGSSDRSGQKNSWHQAGMTPNKQIYHNRFLAVQTNARHMLWLLLPSVLNHDCSKVIIFFPVWNLPYTDPHDWAVGSEPATATKVITRLVSNLNRQIKTATEPEPSI